MNVMAYKVIPIIRDEAEKVLGTKGTEGVRVELGELFGIPSPDGLAAIGSLAFRGKKAVLSMDYTLPEYRGQGMHCHLVRFRLARAKAAGMKFAEATCLRPSIKRYLAEGFVIVRQYKDGWKVRKEL